MMLLTTLTALSLRRVPTIRMQSRAGGGDLRGGQDDARNAEIDKLRRLYLTSPTPPADTTLRRYGRYNDVPLARWGTVFLPHQQEALNIYEPQWVLLFEALLATPPPWLYAAAFLPGGSANLDNPAFALPERGARVGTLLQVPGTRIRVHVHLDGDGMSGDIMCGEPPPHPTTAQEMHFAIEHMYAQFA